jgi:hypothetical protein
MDESPRCPHAFSANPGPHLRERPVEESAKGDRLSLIAYERDRPVENALHRMPPKRSWMESTGKRAAYRCLPVVVANQAGWLVRNPFTFQAIWDGGPGLEQVRFAFPEGPVGWHGLEAHTTVSSHFGSGIFTFQIPFLFRTPPGYNLWVKGPANAFKDGVQALEGMVETDWSHASFTMNWKITRPHHPILFREGEAVCQLLPYPRGLIERFDPEIRPLSSNPELSANFEQWVAGRAEFLSDLADPESDASKESWQKQYFQGRDASGNKVVEHQTAIPSRDFTRVSPARTAK